MHPRKKELALILAVNVVLTLAFAVAMFRRPVWLIGTFLALFAVMSLLLGYRVFAYSNDWFRAQETREQEWYARQPRLMIGITLLTALGLLWQLYTFIQTRL